MLFSRTHGVLCTRLVADETLAEGENTKRNHACQVSQLVNFWYAGVVFSPHQIDKHSTNKHFICASHIHCIVYQIDNPLPIRTVFSQASGGHSRFVGVA